MYVTILLLYSYILWLYVPILLCPQTLYYTDRQHMHTTDTVLLLLLHRSSMMNDSLFPRVIHPDDIVRFHWSPLQYCFLLEILWMRHQLMHLQRIHKTLNCILKFLISKIKGTKQWFKLYLYECGQCSWREWEVFHPSVCRNPMDRHSNTILVSKWLIQNYIHDSTPKFETHSLPKSNVHLVHHRIHNLNRGIGTCD